MQLIDQVQLKRTGNYVSTYYLEEGIKSFLSQLDERGRIEFVNVSSINDDYNFDAGYDFSQFLRMYDSVMNDENLSIVVTLRGTDFSFSVLDEHNIRFIGPEKDITMDSLLYSSKKK